MQHENSRIELGNTRFDLASRILTGIGGEPIALRPQSVEVLLELINRQGQLVARDHLLDTVWSGVHVSDDSLMQCISDIRRAIGDKDHRIIQTVPKKGYRLVATKTSRVESSNRTAPHSLKHVATIAVVVLFAVLGIWTVFSSSVAISDQPTIVVLPFEDLTGDDRWKRLGRGLSIDIANELATNSKIGVIGSETAFDVAALDTLDAGRNLNATFALDGDIQAQRNVLRISARLLDVEEGTVLWSEKWHRNPENYLAIQDDIVTRAHASLVAYFWFGALNRAIAQKAEKKSGPSLTAYEQFLLGIRNIQWTKADYGKALKHFHKAVEIDPDYGRALAMIGLMKLWISDVSKDDVRERLEEESRTAIRKAFSHEPHDAFVIFMMSTVHVAEGRIEAARRSVLTAVEHSPNNPDILAMSALQSITVGMVGKTPKEWAQKALFLNPKGPPWHRLGLAVTTFYTEDYEATISALADAPPHHKKFVYLAAAHMLLGNEKEARAAADFVRKTFPDYTLAGDFDFQLNPSIAHMIRHAALAGVPIGDRSKLPAAAVAGAGN